ncbi:hypothetical protein mvi_59350 [Methylobacterium indicum]|uniref:Uncharacterized protein n=1 Tax=Methylobacterium indicum TaxID=1775910 RepID=A0A8H8X0H9_9HYPH|nr:hypothetical protein mvi_59350 [Methylobacterium indicum]
MAARRAGHRESRRQFGDGREEREPGGFGGLMTVPSGDRIDSRSAWLVRSPDDITLATSPWGASWVFPGSIIASGSERSDLRSAQSSIVSGYGSRVPLRGPGMT